MKITYETLSAASDIRALCKLTSTMESLLRQLRAGDLQVTPMEKSSLGELEARGLVRIHGDAAEITGVGRAAAMLLTERIEERPAVLLGGGGRQVRTKCPVIDGREG